MGNPSMETGYAVQFKRHYLTATPWGFRAYLGLTGHIRRVVDGQVSGDDIRDEAFKSSIVNAWYDHVLTRALQEAFLTLGFSSLYEEPDGEVVTVGGPSVWLARVYRSDDGQLTARYDLNGRDTLHAANGITEREGWQYRGCTVRLVLLDKDVAAEQIEENFKMITAEQLEGISSDLHLSAAAERAVAAAFLWRRDLAREVVEAQRSQTVSSEFLSIEAKGLEGNQRISWDKVGAARGDAKFEVLGFREVGGFSPDPLSETTSGDRVLMVHSNRDGGVVGEYLPRGQTYFYSFFLKHSTTGSKRSWLRFQVRVPTLEEEARSSRETARLTALVERLKDRPPPVPEGEDLVTKMRRKIEEVARVTGEGKATESRLLREMQERWNAEGMPEGDIRRLTAAVKSVTMKAFEDVLSEMGRNEKGEPFKAPQGTRPLTRT